VGQGGIADRVMKTMAGSTRFQQNRSEAQTSASLETAVRQQVPIVACTAGSHFYQQLAQGQSLPPEVTEWYVNAHCYTVLGYDSGSTAVSLRNPWARHPDATEGNFKIPLTTFISGYLGIVTSQ
jgi:hypothetical protein